MLYININCNDLLKYNNIIFFFLNSNEMKWIKYLVQSKHCLDLIILCFFLPIIAINTIVHCLSWG